MQFSRRHFIAGAAGLGAFAITQGDVAAQVSTHPRDDTGFPPVPPDEPVEGPLFLRAGPMLGHVAHDRALIWIKASNTAKPSVWISTSPDLAGAREVEGPALNAETAFAGAVEVGGLEPGKRYFYSVLLDGEAVTLRPHRSFVAAPAPGAPGKTRVCFVSCSGYRGYMAAASWGEMAARPDFDLLLQLGDNHYANTSDLAKQRAHYLMHRRVSGFRELTASVPCLGIWDDHDFGPNDSDGTLKGKEDSLRAFREAWANPAFGTADAPGCFFKTTRGDVDIFLLDVRYHRSPDKAAKDESKTMLGAAQLAWLKRELKASTARFKLIASGSTFETGAPLDSWASYPHERRALLDFLRDEIGDGIILLSGDRHFSAGWQVEGRFIEITSGPVGSGNATAAPGPEQWFSCSTGKMWNVLELDTSGSVPKTAHELWLAGAGMIERRELSWDEVNGRAKIAPSRPLPAAPKPRK